MKKIEIFDSINKKRELRNYISENATKCIRKVRKCVIGNGIFVIITLCMIYIFKNNKDIVNMSILIYIITMGIMLTSYQFIVVF